MKYLIWSFEHGGWWRPGRVGYTTKLAEAGRYGHDQAVAILQQANIITINEAMVPITHAIGDDIIPGGARHKPETVDAFEELLEQVAEFHERIRAVLADELSKS